MVVCVNMMSKGSKEDLTVLIVTHVIHVKRVKISVCLLHNTVYRAMLLILLMSKGSKETLRVLIVTHVTHVKRIKSGVCGLYTQYRYIQCYVSAVSV